MRAFGGLLTAVAAALAIANVAHAGTVSYERQDGDRVTPMKAAISYLEIPGENNVVTTFQGGPADPVTIRDTGALVLPAVPLFSPLGLLPLLENCSFNLTSATCRSWVSGLWPTTALNLGSGNDRASVSSHNTSVDGGSGNDQLSGFGTASVSYHGGSGADIMSGASGLRDGVTYWDYGVGVSVSLDGVANDGMPGEGDNVMPTIEDVHGTPHDDQLVGNSAANHFFGNGGVDVAEGLGGDDDLSAATARGGDGDDELSGRVLDGGAGNDHFSVVNSSSVVDGGAGNDTVGVVFQGGGSIDLGGGDDTVTHHRNVFDPPVALTITCGDGVDTVQALPIDSVAADCENVTIL